MRCAKQFPLHANDGAFSEHSDLAAATQMVPLPAAMQRPQGLTSATGTVTQYFLSLLPSSINTISLGLVVEANTNASSLAPYEVSIAGACADLRPGVGQVDSSMMQQGVNCLILQTAAAGSGVGCKCGLLPGALLLSEGSAYEVGGPWPALCRHLSPIGNLAGHCAQQDCAWLWQHEQKLLAMRKEPQ